MRKASSATNLSIVGAALLVSFTWTADPAQAAETFQLPAGSTIPVMLEKGIDARKNKVGDEVVARTTQNVKSEGQVVMPRGSKIVGHVSEAKARTKEEPESALGIVFDHAVLKDDSEIPLVLEIQAIAPDASAVSPVMTMSPATAGGSTGGAPPIPGQGASAGPMSDPNAGTPGRIASPENSADGARGNLTASGGLTPSCHGVLGIDGLALSPESASPTQGSVIVSQRRNVHLDGRTQMMLLVKGK
jgi:hypothetical protein